MRKVQKFDEQEVYSEISDAIARVAKFNPAYTTSYDIVRDVADGIFYGIQNMPVGEDNKKEILKQVIKRLERM